MKPPKSRRCFFSSTKQNITLAFRTFNRFFRLRRNIYHGNIFQLQNTVTQRYRLRIGRVMSWRTWFLQIVPEWRPQCEGEWQSRDHKGSGCCFGTQNMEVVVFPTSQLQDLVVSSLLVFAPHNWFLSCSLQVLIPNIEIETCFFQLWRGSSLYVFSINCRERERERDWHDWLK